MRLLSAAIAYLVWALVWPLWLCHPKVRGHLRERMGLMPARPPRRRQVPRLWVHGASSGDMLGLVPTLRALRARVAGLEVVATSMTLGGRQVALAHPDVFDAAALSPWDVGICARAAMRRIRPSLLLVEHTELWPQLFAAAAGRQVPLVLHNLHLGGKKMTSYRLLFWCTGSLLRQAQRLLVRSEADLQRALALGARPGSAVVTGSTKYDQRPSQAAPSGRCALAGASSRPQRTAPLLWVAGSTHRGEETQLLTLLQRLRHSYCQLRLVLVPRYPRRAQSLVRLARRYGMSAQLSSELPVGPPRATPPAAAQPQPLATVIIVDQMGTLASWYAQADVVFVGGTLVARGGQNLLEPALVGKAIIYGPSTHNFEDIAAALHGHGGLRIADTQQLQACLAHLLAHPQVRVRLGLAAQRRALSLGGAAQRNAQHLAQVLATTPAASKTLPLKKRPSDAA